MGPPLFASAARLAAAARSDEGLQTIYEAAASRRVDAVDALAAVALLHEQARVQQHLDMMGDRGTCQMEPLREIADVQPLAREQHHDLLARRVAERRERPSELDELVRRGRDRG